MVALCNAFDDKPSRSDEVALQSRAVQMELIESVAAVGHQHVASTGDIGIEEIVDVIVLVTADIGQGVDDAVGLAVYDEDATIVHLHPYVLRLVNDKVVQTVV